MDIPLPLEAEIQCTLYAARCDAFKLSGENPRVWNPRCKMCVYPVLYRYRILKRQNPLRDERRRTPGVLNDRF